MKKVGRPTGLIAYDTDENVLLRWSGKAAAKFRLIRPRTVLYAIIMLVVAGLMAFGLATRSDLDLNVLKDRSLPFVQLSTGEIRNGYTVKVVNKAHELRDLQISIAGIDGAGLSVVGETVSDASGVTIRTEPDGVDRYRVLVTAPAAALDADGSTRLRFLITDAASGEQQTNVVPFLGPERR